MPKSGYKGISFPFRISSQGGVVMTTTDYNNPTHIEESIKQILGTNYLERVMQPEVYSRVSSALFEPNDTSLLNLLKTRIVEDLERLDSRITIEEGGVEVYSEEVEGVTILYVSLTYQIISYETTFTTKVEVGEI